MRNELEVLWALHSLLVKCVEVQRWWRAEGRWPRLMKIVSLTRWLWDFRKIICSIHRSPTQVNIWLSTFSTLWWSTAKSRSQNLESHTDQMAWHWKYSSDTLQINIKDHVFSSEFQHFTPGEGDATAQIEGRLTWDLFHLHADHLSAEQIVVFLDFFETRLLGWKTWDSC